MRKSTSAIICAVVLGAAASTYNLRGATMPEIKFNIGENIYETAKTSGAPKYSTGNVAGLISYEIDSLPPDIPARYQRQGYEITALPLFAFTMYADEESNDGLAVQTATLQFSKNAATSHLSAQTFVSDLISQFQKGKWTRHIRELCPSVSGRSAFLNEHGEPARIGTCPLDPAYRLSNEDWLRMMKLTQYYQWAGDGVLATLTIRYSDDVRGITYSIDLEFEDIAVKTRRENANRARDLAEGDAQGRNSTAKDRDAKLARRSLIKILEENARKRGDPVLPR